MTAGVASVEVDPGGPDGSRVHVLGERIVIDGRAHAELLALGVQAAVAQAGVQMRDLAAVAAGIGPGPYTGLRVGIVSAASFGDALGIATYGVCSLDAIGAGAGHPGELLVAGDARRREVYWARYRGGERIGDVQVHRPSELGALLHGAGVTAMTGAGARQYADVLALPLLGVDYPPVAQLAALAADRALSGAPSEILVPMYLRRPDAVPPSGIKSALR